MDRIQSLIERGARRPSTRNTVIDVEVIPPNSGRKKIHFLPIGSLLLS